MESRISVNSFFYGFDEQIAAYRRFPFAMTVGRIAPVVPMHTHSFFEIDFVLSGSGSNVVNGRKYELRKHDLIIGNLCDFHAIHARTPISMCSIKFDSVLFTPSVPAAGTMPMVTTPFMAWCGSFRNRIRLAGQEGAALRLLIASLRTEYFSQRAFREDAIINLLHALLIHIRRAFDTYCREHAIVVNDSTWPLVHRITNYIDKHAHTDIYIRDLSKKFSLSQQRLGNIFHAATGASLKHYLTVRRVTDAQRRLVLTDEPISDIAFACGFMTIGAFTRAFYRMHKKSPRCYRQAYRQK